MHAELDHYSTTYNRSHREVLIPGQERVYPDPTVNKRVTIVCRDDVEEAVVITTENRSFQEIPNGFLKRVLTLRASHKVPRWDVVSKEVMGLGQEKSLMFSEGLGDFGILRVRVQE